LQLRDPENNGDFRADVPLLPGEYEYKFVINGEWVADVSCPRWTVNEHHTLNSILEVSAKIPKPVEPEPRGLGRGGRMAG
jgi:hypothetical protein